MSLELIYRLLPGRLSLHEFSNSSGIIQSHRANTVENYPLLLAEVEGSFHSITNKYFLGLLFVITVLFFIRQDRDIDPCYVLINASSMRAFWFVFSGTPASKLCSIQNLNQSYSPLDSNFLPFRQTVKSQWHKPLSNTSTPFVAD